MLESPWGQQVEGISNSLRSPKCLVHCLNQGDRHRHFLDAVNFCDGVRTARSQITQPPSLLNTYSLLISIPGHPGEQGREKRSIRHSPTHVLIIRVIQIHTTHNSHLYIIQFVHLQAQVSIRQRPSEKTTLNSLLLNIYKT